MENAVQVSQLYQDITHHISSALDNIASLNVSSEEGRKHVSSITSNLQTVLQGFTDELSFLQQHAEWDHFTLAFFGETNAGKSTLIESLRILFNEQARRALLAAQQNDLEKAQRCFTEAATTLREQMDEVYQQVAAGLAEMETRSLQLIVLQKKSTRAALCRVGLFSALGGLIIGAAAAVLFISQAGM